MNGRHKRPHLWIAALFLLFLAAALTGCGIRSGTVYEKEYDDADVWWSTMCTPAGKTTICVPHQYYDPERYILRLEAWENGERKTGSVSVPQSTWDRFEVGDTYKESK